jgi:hypothetical protein
MPQFKEKMEKYSLHMDVTKSCMNVYNHTKLEDLAGTFVLVKQVNWCWQRD